MQQYFLQNAWRYAKTKLIIKTIAEEFREEGKVPTDKEVEEHKLAKSHNMKPKERRAVIVILNPGN
jgi:hypothetical protein